MKKNKKPTASHAPATPEFPRCLPNPPGLHPHGEGGWEWKMSIITKAVVNQMLAGMDPIATGRAFYAEMGGIQVLFYIHRDPARKPL